MYLVFFSEEILRDEVTASASCENAHVILFQCFLYSTHPVLQIRDSKALFQLTNLSASHSTGPSPHKHPLKNPSSTAPCFTKKSSTKHLAL